MAVTVTVTPAAPLAVESVCKFDIAGLSLNDATTFNATKSPSMDEIRYYITFEKGGAELGRSPVFACNHDGEWQFNNYVFPSAGSWSVKVKKASDNSTVKTQAVTVS